VFTLSKCLDDEGEVEEGEEEYVELFEAGEDSSEAFEPAEEPFDLISFSVEAAVVLPRFDAVGLRRHDGDHAQAEHKLSGLIAFVGTIHQQRKALGHWPETGQQSTAFGSIVSAARR
jgi:hypothetical protein